ncbi:MAG: hypothetical protein ABH950_01085, partial [Candidatus Altiarchaeota archaeon]
MVHVESRDLMTKINEMTDGNSRIPWEELATKESRKAFIQARLAFRVGSELPTDSNNPYLNVTFSPKDESYSKDFQKMLSEFDICSHHVKSGGKVQSIKIGHMRDMHLLAEGGFLTQKPMVSAIEEAYKRFLVSNGSFDVEEYLWVKDFKDKHQKKIRETRNKAAYVTAALNRHLLRQEITTENPFLSKEKIEVQLKTKIRQSPELLRRQKQKVSDWIKAEGAKRPIRFTAYEEVKKIDEEIPDSRIYCLLCKGLGMSRKWAIKLAGKQPSWTDIIKKYSERIKKSKVGKVLAGQGVDPLKYPELVYAPLGKVRVAAPFVKKFEISESDAVTLIESCTDPESLKEKVEVLSDYLIPPEILRRIIPLPPSDLRDEVPRRFELRAGSRDWNTVFEESKKSKPDIEEFLRENRIPLKKVGEPLGSLRKSEFTEAHQQGIRLVRELLILRTQGESAKNHLQAYVIQQVSQLKRYPVLKETIEWARLSVLASVLRDKKSQRRIRTRLEETIPIQSEHRKKYDGIERSIIDIGKEMGYPLAA